MTIELEYWMYKYVKNTLSIEDKNNNLTSETSDEKEQLARYR